TGGFNALRVISGETPDRAGTGDEIVCLETNIDNMTPEMLSFAMERIFEAGAVDVFFTPVYMKKNRPAVLLTALTNAENEAAVIEAVLKHTSTLGIRRRVSERYCMERKMAAVETGYGPVKIKYAQNGNIKKLSPEYEDCRAIAIKTGLTIKEVYDMALALAPERLKKTRVKK
ncbi:MAG: nickel insertion protein, partial [Candidatus Goldiibacteriota bacterium]